MMHLPKHRVVPEKKIENGKPAVTEVAQDDAAAVRSWITTALLYSHRSYKRNSGYNRNCGHTATSAIYRNRNHTATVADEHP